jgi:hypothetical protein
VDGAWIWGYFVVADLGAVLGANGAESEVE